MLHIHWVTRQNKPEIPRDKDEVNNREIHECDGRSHDPGAHDPGTMVAPLIQKLWKGHPRVVHYETINCCLL
jgi:hypothetical protein